MDTTARQKPLRPRTDDVSGAGMRLTGGLAVFIEKWRDMAALGAHGGGPNIKALNEGLKGLVAGAPDVQVLEAVPAGDTSKGAV